MRTIPRSRITHQQQLVQLRVGIGMSQAIEQTEGGDREGQRDRQGPEDCERKARGPGEALRVRRMSSQTCDQSERFDEL